MCSLTLQAAEIVVGKIGSKITSKAGCVDFDVAGASACEAAGLGPEDPLADACAVTIAAGFQVACSTAVAAGANLTGAALKKALGCAL